MQPSEYYDSILQSITVDDERRVFQLLSAHIGEPVTRQFMISMLFGIMIDEDGLSNNRQDRIIRKCIENLRNQNFPIVSTAGEAGYCLTDDVDQIRACIAEAASRVKKMQDQINHLYESMGMARNLYQWRRGAELPVQARMF
jgi:hypothetical protein